MTTLTAPNTRILPKALPPGGCIGIISPAYPTTDATQFEIGEAWLTAQGYRVKRFPHADGQWRYLAGTDADRLADLHAAFADPEVDAVWCARGGYGCLRLVDKLDFDLLAQHPKPFIGFSDVTVLQQALYQRLGWVSYYGPMVTSNLGDTPGTPALAKGDEAPLYTLIQSLAVVRGNLSLPHTVPNLDTYHCIRPGVAEAPLIGGNLTLLAALCGTPYHPKTEGHLLFIEDWQEEFYSLDRQFQQLRLAGLFDNIAGLLLGDFSQSTAQAGLTLPELFTELVGDLAIPVGYGYTIGHGEETATLPIGIRARFDATAGTLTLLEKPVA